MFERKDFPQDSWTLDELAGYARTKLRRTAVEAWHIGRALLIAERKLKDEHGFDAWVKKEVGISRPTSWRYRQMASIFTHQDVQQLTLGEVYGRIEAMRQSPEDAGHNEDDEQENDPVVVPANRPEPRHPPEGPANPSKPTQPSWPGKPDAPIIDNGEADGGKSERMPAWAKGPADKLHNDDEVDLIVECDKFIQCLDDYRASNESAFSDPEYVERVREKLTEVVSLVAKLQKSLGRKRAA